MDAIEEAEVVALCSNNSESNSASSNNTASNNDQQCALAVVKGKRTKRQRLQPCLAPGTATASASSNSSDVEVSSSTTDEDEDMANCLILLARGRAAPNAAVPHPVSSAEEAIALINRAPAEKFTSRRFTETATTTEGKAGFYVYECKTCNKCFPSFQALGGHRASHKKPKIAAPADEKKTPTELVDEDSLQIGMNSFSKAVAAPSSNTSVSAVNTKPRVHECSICGSEFSSGQALGGHMRRHRPLTVAESSPEMKKERNVLSLDLNLPAPSDDGNGEFAKPPATAVAFQFESKPSLVFSASALVGCHY